MKPKLISAALILAAGLTGQDAKPTETRVAPTNELFPGELRAARQLHGDWNAKDDELDEARRGGSLNDPEVYKNLRSQLSNVLNVKHAELEAWTLYYQRTADHWQSVLKAIQSGQPARATERQDLGNMLGIEKRERDDIQKRLNDLVQTLSEKGVSANQPATTDLRKLLELKQDNIDKLDRAIREYDAGVSHLDKRRDLARARSLQARQLLRSVELERSLWDALYSGRLHRLDLQYDSSIPEPERRPDWRTKIGPGSESPLKDNGSAGRRNTEKRPGGGSQ